jgi:hypothetical protein
VNLRKDHYHYVVLEPSPQLVSRRCLLLYTRLPIKSSLQPKKLTTLSNGYLGSHNDEERSEMRYVMRIAEFSESLNLRTQVARSGYP